MIKYMYTKFESCFNFAYSRSKMPKKMDTRTDIYCKRFLLNQGGDCLNPWKQGLILNCNFETRIHLIFKT